MTCVCGRDVPDEQERCDQCGRWVRQTLEERARAEALAEQTAREDAARAVPRPKPTREAVLDYRSDGWYTSSDHRGPSPWAMYGYAAWDETRRQDARRLWRSIGVTHVSPTWALNYPRSGQPVFDLRSTPDVFTARLKELKDDGFVVAVPLCQEEAYGKYDDYTLAQNLADLERWPAWGWSQYIDIVWPGWESIDFMTATDHILVLRQARATFGAEMVLAVQPGRSAEEPRFWVADSHYPEPYDSQGWWAQMHDARIALDLFFAEPSMAAFSGDDWKEKVYSELMNLSARVYQTLDPVPDRYPFPPSADCRAEHEGWTRCPPIQGGGVPLVYFEGPAWLNWPSWKKAQGSAVALLVPGVIGVGDGIPTS